MKLSKTILAVLATGLLSCGLFSQQGQAALIQGNINFAGSVEFDTNSLATAMEVSIWNDIFNNAGFSSVTGGATGDFSGIAAGTSAAMATPWIFNPSTATPGLWSVGGFTFNLDSSNIENQTSMNLTISGLGFVTGNGFDDTPIDWLFTSQNAGGQNMQEFSFSANSNADGVPVPEGGSTVALLGLGLAGLELIRRRMLKTA
ncbi:MAG: VPDSG-CTERM sorting domain-containing protein [Pyrinomonadaceae bacterium]|nr:VPDSG-CTERM sorting domain-containing protein [Pyrinomonadaceae bacterium]